MNLNYGTAAEFGSVRPMKTLQSPVLDKSAKTSPPAAAWNPSRQTQSGSVPGKRAIRVLVVDDHPVVRQGLSACLAGHQHLTVVGQAADGRDAVRQAKELSPDVVLMDIDMPQMNGLGATELLRKENPNVKVLVLSMHRHPEYVLRILQSGARGYVLKEAGADEMIKAIEMVYAGEAFFSSDVARMALNQFVHGNGEGPQPGQLSNREREVLVAIAEGLSN